MGRRQVQGCRKGRCLDQGRLGHRVRRVFLRRKITCGDSAGRWEMKRLLVVAVLGLVGASCTRPQQGVVVYCSADKEFAELVFHAYEAKTGIKVLPLYDTEETKTAGLTARLVAEKAQPKADVFWSSDTSRAVALVDQGIAASYVSRAAAAIPARY